MRLAELCIICVQTWAVVLTRTINRVSPAMRGHVNTFLWPLESSLRPPSRPHVVLILSKTNLRSEPCSGPLKPLIISVTQASLVSLSIHPHHWLHLGPVWAQLLPHTVCVLCLGALTFLLLGECFSSPLLLKIYMLTRRRV